MIEAKGIFKSYGKKKVLDDLNFYVPDSSCIGIIGVNGSGKSTLLSILAGVQAATKGSVSYRTSPDSQPFSIKDKRFSKNIGYVPQEDPLIEELTVMDNLKLWYCDSVLDLTKELKTGVLHILGVDEFTKTKVKNLSGGMKKRLSIGISMAEDPSFLILDEPGAALDLLCQDAIRRYLRIYKEKGGTIIIATHDQEELSLCDDIYIMDNGRLTKTDSSLRGEGLLNRLRNSNTL